MKIPFQVRRLGESAPVAAVLVPGHQPVRLLQVCAGLESGTFPTVYRVADGFLVLVPARRKAPEGVVRLRSLGANVFLPANGELLPALLPDEAQALGRQRGLVFLPGGRVLEFPVDKPVSLAELLKIGPIRRRNWQTLPDGVALADRLTEITLEGLPENPDDALQPGGEGIGAEEPQPEDAGPVSKVLGKTSLGLGKGMAWLGHKLGWQGLANLGAKLAAGAMSLVPRLSEKVLGKQEASLRELLKDFQNGNIERALRRALPLGGDSQRGVQEAANADLPRHRGYSLADLLARGAGGNWFTSSNTYWELEREYRKQAELAAQRGDFRRAAFIYGKLLNDYRQAAAVLARGGLHHDSALIYRSKLHDHLAAAREFEAAGEYDRALHHYRLAGDHALAGDLLQRLGEDDRAVTEYRLAADMLVNADKGHYQAGELMLNRARRTDLAIDYFSAGWKLRPAGAAVPCAIRLLQLHAQAEDTAALRQVVAEAEQVFAPPGHDNPAVEFFNELARLGDKTDLADLGEELRDRALLGLAGKVRQRLAEEGQSGYLVTTAFPPGSTWSAALASDARFAAKTTMRKPRPAPASFASGMTLVPIFPGRTVTVTAVCQASLSGHIVLGFETGEVAVFNPLRGEVISLDTGLVKPISSLAISPDAKAMVVLGSSLNSFNPDDCLSSFVAQGPGPEYLKMGMQVLRPEGPAWLCPQLTPLPEQVACLWEGERFRFYSGARLIAGGHWEPEDKLAHAGFLFRRGGYNILALDGQDIQCGFAAPTSRCHLGWGPTMPNGSTLFHPHLSWLPREADKLELAGVGPDGALYWSELELRGNTLASARTEAEAAAEPYLAVTIFRPGLLAAVTANTNTVHWLRKQTRGFGPCIQKRAAMPTPLACFPQERGQELIVICQGGVVARVPFGG